MRAQTILQKTQEAAARRRTPKKQPVKSRRGLRWPLMAALLGAGVAGAAVMRRRKSAGPAGPGATGDVSPSGQPGGTVRPMGSPEGVTEVWRQER
ncbi:hypothetical protein [Micromonospora sp. URMC 103]|uniref:hypothetical protein n=1 Tax=Micromonospora sp. URMC 103 TaxID=3423406 RepID=UPI003F1C9540